jgi:hypothetical protein
MFDVQTTAREARKLRLRIASMVLVCLALIWSAALFELSWTKNSYLHKAELGAAVQDRVFAENTQSTIKRINEVLLDTPARLTSPIPFTGLQIDQTLNRTRRSDIFLQHSNACSILPGLYHGKQLTTKFDENLICLSA